MAEKLEVIITGKDQLSPKLGSIKANLKSVGNVATLAIGQALGGALLQVPGLAISAGKALGQLVSDAASVDQVRQTFDKLAESIGTTSDAMLISLREATRGMVNDAELMQASNKFTAMGLAETEQEAKALAEMATQLGLAMGEDATASMENFALMLANQSIPRLDSFGISSGTVRTRIDELMESTEGLTREQAFLQAVMEEGTKTMAKVGEQGDSARADLDKIKATFDNIKDSLGRALLPALETLLGIFADFMQEHGPKVQELLIKIGEQFGDWVEDKLPAIIDWLDNKLNPSLEDTTDMMSGLKDVFETLGKIWEISEEWGGKLTGVFDGMTKTTRDWGDALRDLTGIPMIQLPDWLTPGSPTPLEIGIRGVTDALGDLRQAQSNTFNNYNLTIHSQATRENLEADFQMMKSFAGAGV